MILPSEIIRKAANNRHGIVLSPQRVTLSQSDIQSIFHVGVPNSVNSPWQSAAGGVGWDEETASMAAICEGIERQCAALVRLPEKFRKEIPTERVIDATEFCLFSEEQRRTAGFPFNNIYSDQTKYSPVCELVSSDEFWVPNPLVVLRDDYKTGIPTSSGLAVGPNFDTALLRAIEELIERDALMTTWLFSIAARRINVPKKYTDMVEKLNGEFWAFDLTPDYSPFPVIAVAGGIKKRGVWRYSLGVACREDWLSALDKAFLEWNQGVLFAGIFNKFVDTEYLRGDLNIKTFDEHAIFYTVNQDLWRQIPMFAQVNDRHEVFVRGQKYHLPQDAVKTATQHFKRHNIKVFYRDLTTVDARQLGLSVVRALSPDMVSIFSHQEWPLIGNVENKLASRYEWAMGQSVKFPNKLPHPLG